MRRMSALIEFLFILAVPLVLVGGAVVTLFALGALFDALDHPAELSGRIQAAFQRPLRPARTVDERHYYRPYWQGP
jgi:hypothetical protein